jgi:hypothetical protein
MEQKKIMSYLRGGLGNQLFQIAAAYNFALKNNYELVLQDVYQIGDRTTYYNNLFVNLKKYIGIVNGTWYNENPHFEYVEIPDYKTDMVISGYFQSEKFFKENEKQVRELFELPQDLKEFVHKKKEEWNISKDILIGIHIRRTDFLKLSDLHPVQSKEYFENGKKYIEEKLGFRPTYLYFSDDKQWVKENFKLINKDKIVYFDHDYEEFALLRSCDHFVIANSTFSWWGAWLSSNLPRNEKIVVAPQKWFGPKNDKTEKYIFCEEWFKTENPLNKMYSVYMKNFFEHQKKVCGWHKCYYGVFSSIINENNYKKVLEVGCAYGFHVKQVITNTDVGSYTMVDPYVPYSNDGFSDSVQNVFRDGTETLSNFDQFLHIVLEELTEYKNKITHIRKPSVEAAKEIEDNSLDAIFVDGDHSYTAVKEDLTAWWPKIRTEGTICGDDYWMPDVARAVHEFASEHQLEVKFRTRDDTDYKIYYFKKI